MQPNEYEVIIVGGSYAGLSSALALGRSLRKTLVIDAGKPCNRQTPHSHNFLTQDGKTPKEIADVGIEQVKKYDTVEFYDGLAVSGRRMYPGFEIVTSKGDIFTAQKLIFATGVKDLMPEIDGFSECWGISVVHCPYCHGYEIRGKKTALIANEERAFHLSTLVHNLSKNITILTSGKPELDEDELLMLEERGIRIIETEVSAIEHENGQMHRIVFKDGSTEDFDCAYASVPFEQSTDLPEKLGCRMTEMGHIEIDHFQQTTEDHIFACGDSSSMMRSVANAVYGGNVAGAMVNNELAMDNF